MISAVMDVDVNYATRVAHYSAGSSYGPRQLHEYEFVWILSGGAVWHYRDPAAGTVFTTRLDPGAIALARPGGVHSFAWDERGSSSHAYVHFDLVGDAPSPSGPWPLVRAAGHGTVLRALCDYLLRLSSQDRPEALELHTRVVGVLLNAFLDQHDLGVDPRLASGPIASALEHVNSRWGSEQRCAIALTELAAAAGVSVGHLSRLFGARFGHGMSASLELVRLASAAGELQRSNLTIDQVVRRNGFANPYHFSRRFSRAYGLPPGRFRRRDDLDALAPIVDRGLLPLWTFLRAE